MHRCQALKSAERVALSYRVPHRGEDDAVDKWTGTEGMSRSAAMRHMIERTLSSREE
jgi:hypothetical protein